MRTTMSLTNAVYRIETLQIPTLRNHCTKVKTICIPALPCRRDHMPRNHIRAATPYVDYHYRY
jgi:hypothetical protein